MTKRIFRSIFLVSLSVLLLCFLLFTGFLYSYFGSVEKSTLASQLQLASDGVLEEGAAFLKIISVKEYRFTLIAADGTVLSDSQAEASQMENHADREEFTEALSNGVGESERFSSTLSQKTLYRAQRLPDGTVLRVSVTVQSVFALLLGMLPAMLLVLLLALLLSAVLARKVAKRIVVPLQTLDLESPLENDTYEELSPLLVRLDQQHRQIIGQLTALQKKQDEFSAVTGGMNEGLLLLNEHGEILSINPAAVRLFHAQDDCIGKNILTVDRTLSMQELIRNAGNGTRGEITLSLSGGSYRVHASPVISEEKLCGICILIFDVTEAEKAEALRREFSANVSHELKTPLQSVLGAAELLQNGLVKEKDLPAFADRIYSEASRLVTLIDDILRLSQLDEGASFEKEEVDLLSLAQETAAQLSACAEKREVSLTCQGDAAMVFGVRRLLSEILFNLCDNAIKYNVPGGSVCVTVKKAQTSVTLTVADTGIGIPEAAKDRIFERFYRVDKSRSKETGGTGLGLSIVKHAVQYHGATLSLSSEEGKGTSVSIVFPAF